MEDVITKILDNVKDFFYDMRTEFKYGPKWYKACMISIVLNLIVEFLFIVVPNKKGIFLQWNIELGSIHCLIQFILCIVMLIFVVKAVLFFKENYIPIYLILIFVFVLLSIFIGAYGLSTSVLLICSIGGLIQSIREAYYETKYKLYMLQQRKKLERTLKKNNSFLGFAQYVFHFYGDNPDFIYEIIQRPGFLEDCRKTCLMLYGNDLFDNIDGDTYSLTEVVKNRNLNKSAKNLILSYFEDLEHTDTDGIYSPMSQMNQRNNQSSTSSTSIILQNSYRGESDSSRVSAEDAKEYEDALNAHGFYNEGGVIYVTHEYLEQLSLNDGGDKLDIADRSFLDVFSIGLFGSIEDRMKSGVDSLKKLPWRVNVDNGYAAVTDIDFTGSKGDLKYVHVQYKRKEGTFFPIWT